MIRPLAGVARAPFLLLPVTLVAVGAAAAAWEGSFSWLRTGIALIGLVAAHAAVNALNEVSDFKTGIDLHTRRTPFSGGSGTLPAGEIEPWQAMVVAAAGAAIASIAGATLFALVDPGRRPILLAIMLAGAVAVLAYTDVLARAFVGELAAGLGLGALPVFGTALVQGGAVGPASAAAALTAFWMTFDLLLLNEFPDQEADLEGGRRNLVLLLGRRGAARLYATVALLVPVTLVGAVVMRVLPPLALVAVAPSLLLGSPLGWALGRPGDEVPLSAMRANVLWNLATNGLLALALAATAGLRG